MLQMRSTNVLLVLFAVFALGYAVNVEVESMTDLEQAAQLAMSEGDNGVWYVRVFAANNSTDVVKGPFSEAGLHPVKANQLTGTVDKAAVIKSLLTTGNPNVAPTPIGNLVQAKILPAAPANPLLPVDYKGPVKPLSEEDLKKLKPAVVLGIPDKKVDPEAYKEWKKSQAPFGYLGLDKVKPTKEISTKPVVVKTRRNKTKLLNPVKVIENPSAYDTVVKPVNTTGTSLGLPTIIEGVIPAEVLPVAKPELVARSLDYYDLTMAPNAAAPVPGAAAAPVFPAQAALLQVEDEAEFFVPMTFEQSEEAAAETQEEGWNTLHAGVSDLISENLNYHDTSAAQLNQMSSDIAAALQVDSSLISLGEEVDMDSLAEVQAEVDQHHELASEHDISNQFKFVRAAGVLGRSMDVMDAEQEQLASQLENHISFLEQSLSTASESAEEEAHEEEALIEADAEEEVDADAEAEAETEESTAAETEVDAEAETEANSPVVKYYKARLSQLGFPITPSLSRYIWRRIQSLPTRYVTAYGTRVNPHPIAVRVLAERLRNARAQLRAYRLARGQKIRKLAYRTQKFLNKLARASMAERRVVARALATRPQDFRRRRSLRSLIRKYKKQAKKATKAEKATKEAEKVAASAKAEVKALAAAPKKEEVKPIAKVEAPAASAEVTALKEKVNKLEQLVVELQKSKVVAAQKASNATVAAPKVAKKTAKKAVKAAKKAAKKSVDVKKACANAAQFAAKCSAKKRKSVKCARAAKVVKLCKSKKLSFVETEAEEETEENTSLVETESQETEEAEEADQFETELDEAFSAEAEEEAELDNESEDIGDIVSLASRALAEDAEKPKTEVQRKIESLSTIPTFNDAPASSFEFSNSPNTPLSQIASLM